MLPNTAMDMQGAQGVSSSFRARATEKTRSTVDASLHLLHKQQNAGWHCISAAVIATPPVSPSMPPLSSAVQPRGAGTT